MLNLINWEGQVEKGEYHWETSNGDSLDNFETLFPAFSNGGVG
jgi:hypothetical protein